MDCIYAAGDPRDTVRIKSSRIQRIAIWLSYQNGDYGVSDHSVDSSLFSTTGQIVTSD